MTDSEMSILLLKCFSTFFILGCAYVISTMEGSDDDDDDDDEGMYQLAYVTNE